MGYIARNNNTNEVYYSKGANKIANLIGCTSSNITKYFLKNKNNNLDKTIREWTVSKTTDLNNKKRGYSLF